MTLSKHAGPPQNCQHALSSNIICPIGQHPSSPVLMRHQASYEQKEQIMFTTRIKHFRVPNTHQATSNTRHTSTTKPQATSTTHQATTNFLGTATRHAKRSLPGPGFIPQALDFTFVSRRRLPPRAGNHTNSMTQKTTHRRHSDTACGQKSNGPGVYTLGPRLRVR